MWSLKRLGKLKNNLPTLRYFYWSPQLFIKNLTSELHQQSQPQSDPQLGIFEDPKSLENIHAIVNEPKLDNALKTTEPQTLEFRKAAPFDDIPGPQWLKSISNLWSYVPIIENHLTTRTLQFALSADKKFGNQLSWGNNLALFKYLLNEYGPIVRLHGPFGGDVVIISRPEHANVILQNEGPHPIRSSLDCLEKYRLECRKYKNAGPFVMQGPEWEAMRSTIEKAMKESLKNTSKWLNDASSDFATRIKVIRNRQQEAPVTFLQELQKWSLECLCGVVFNQSFGFLSPRGYASHSENAILLDALNEATASIKKCEFGFHLWKLIETPSWKKLVIHCDTIDNILAMHLRKSQEALRKRTEKSTSSSSSTDDASSSKELSLVDFLLLKESMSGEDILTLLLDMLIFGVNMTAYSAGFLLYHLAKNPREQVRLHSEMKHLNFETVSSEDLKNIKYLKSCLHESLRLKPPMPVLSRILSRDVAIYGYKVPKGTFVLIATNLSSVREEHFEDALKFKPSRWLESQDATEEAASLATLPFGYGPRACFARDLAEMQVYHLVAKILQKFRVEYHYGDIESNNKLLSTPSRPLKLRFVERVRD